MELRRPSRPKALISLVPMIDVMLILLVFFMVTSTYLNLDMIPASQRDRAAAAPALGATPGEGARPLMIRLAANGVPHVQGRPLDPAALTDLLRARLADAPGTPVLLLPSGAANTQALIAVMDTAARAGAAQVRVIRLEARE